MLPEVDHPLIGRSRLGEARRGFCNNSCETSPANGEYPYLATSAASGEPLYPTYGSMGGGVAGALWDWKEGPKCVRPA